MTFRGYLMNREDESTVRVAVVQCGSELMDRERTVEKVIKLMEECGRHDVQLALFPEALIPGYPWYLNFATSVGHRERIGRRAWRRYWENSIEVLGKETDLIAETAREANLYAAVGVIEKDSEFSGGTLYCTVLYFGPDGSLIGKHRKLKLTAAERYIWGEGDGSTMPVFHTPVGSFGALICWENYMPLARMTMYSKGLDIYLAPTADSRDSWQNTIRHIAVEGRCFVLSACQFIRKDAYPEDLEVISEIEDAPEIISRGGSAIVNPFGEYVKGPLFNEEGILIADIDLREVVEGRYDFDVVGHYARPDVFK